MYLARELNARGARIEKDEIKIHEIKHGKNIESAECKRVAGTTVGYF